MQHIKCILDIKTGSNVISRDVMPAHWQPEMVESTTKLLHSASKDPLKILGQITLHLRNGNRSKITLFSVVDKLTIDVLLGTTPIGEHIIAILRDERKLTVRDSNPVACIAQGVMPANAVLTKKRHRKCDKQYSS